MALGQALTLAGALFLQPDKCEFIVLGTPEPTSEFLQLLNLYRQGVRDEPIAKLAGIHHDELKFFLHRVLLVRDMAAPGPRRTVEPNDSCLEAASLLETELAMTQVGRSRWEDADSHFDEAWQISFLIETPVDRLRFQRNWLLAAGLFYHQLIFVSVAEEAFMRAGRLLRNAVRLYPNDPEVLLAAGSLLEWSGSLRWGVAAHLKEAEELYSRARRFAPTDPEILLRHGWVLEKLEKEDEAAPPLRRVLELDARKDLTYRSRMVLGRMAERAGRLTEAIGHYEAAADTIPSWQVAYLAAGHALHASGSHERAREALDHALAMDLKSADATLGGWWSYELGIALRFEPLFERLRAEVMR